MGEKGWGRGQLTHGASLSPLPSPCSEDASQVPRRHLSFFCSPASQTHLHALELLFGQGLRHLPSPAAAAAPPGSASAWYDPKEKGRRNREACPFPLVEKYDEGALRRYHRGTREREDGCFERRSLFVCTGERNSGTGSGLELGGRKWRGIEMREGTN